MPMEDINLHFTGDFAAIALAHNLLSALIDNHINHGNELGFDVRRIAWKRVLDMNDRALRDVVVAFVVAVARMQQVRDTHSEQAQAFFQRYALEALSSRAADSRRVLRGDGQA